MSASQLSGTVDLNALNDVPAQDLNNLSIGLAELLPNAPDDHPIYTPQSPGELGGILTSFYGHLLTVQGVLQTTIAPAGGASQIPNFYAPLASVDASYESGGVTQNETIYYPTYVWVDLGPAPNNTLTITSPNPETASIQLVANSSGSITSAAQAGSIDFTDTDPNTTPTGSTENPTVTVTDASGNDITSQLTSGQISALEDAFNIAPAPGNMNNGAIDWTYNPQGTALEFLTAGETAVVTSTVQVSDQDGNTASDNVVISVTGQGGLFTTGDDDVNFNIDQPGGLSPAQQAAIAGGGDIYHGLGGDDVVTLPNEANYDESVGNGQTLGWTDTPASTFYTGSQVGDIYTVNGGVGDYYIVEGAGTEFITINGNGSSRITAGSGADTITITGDGDNTITAGSGTASVSISGTGDNTFEGDLTGSAAISDGGTLDITGNLSGSATIGAGSFLELGGTASGLTVNNDATLYIDSGGMASGTTINSGGSVYVEPGGQDISPILAGGDEYDQDDGVDLNATIDSGGIEYVLDGAVATSPTINSGGDMVVEDPGTVVNPTINGGTLELQAGAVVTGPITFTGTSGTLQIDGTTMPTNVISGFTLGDTIDLAGDPFDNQAATLFQTSNNSVLINNVLHVADELNPTLYLDPSEQFSGGFSLSPDSGTGTKITPSLAPVVGGNFITPLRTYSTTVDPYDSVVLIRYGNMQATGFIIGPYSILTAAHVVDNAIVQDQGLTIITADGSSVGPIDLSNIHIDPDYNPDSLLPTNPANDQDDLAVINVATNLSSYGSFQLAADYSGGTVNITGYPGSQGGFQVNDIGTVTSDPNFNTLDEGTATSTPGESGGPVWIYNGSVAQAVGIVSADFLGTSYDVQLTPNDLTLISNFEAADQFVSAGQSVSNVAVTNGTSLNVLSDGTATNITIGNGGTETIDAGGIDAGSTIAGGTLELQAGAVVSGSSSFSGNGGALRIDDLASAPGGAQQTDFNAVISDLAVGDVVRVEGFGNFATIDAATPTYNAATNTTTLALTDLGSPVATLNLAGDYSGDLFTVTQDPNVAGAVDVAITPTTTTTVAVSISNTDVTVADDTGTVTFAFSQAPVDFALTDVTAPDGTLSNLSGSGTSYTATFTANAGIDDPNATVSVTGGSYHDADGNAGTGGSTAPFTVDTVTPTVTAIAASPSSGDKNTGSTISLTVTFSENVTVTGTPLLTLNDGGEAAYQSGSGSNVLIFTYIVANAQNVSALSVTGNNLNGSTIAITDASGGEVDLSGADVSFSDLAIGATVQSIIANPPTGDLGPGQTVSFTVTMSEPVKITGGKPFLMLNDGGEAIYKSGSGTNVLTFTYKVGALGSGQNAASLAVTGFNPNGATVYDLNIAADTADLSGVTAFTSGPQIDTTAPTVSSVVAAPTNGDLDAGKTVLLTVTFGAMVTVTGNPYLSLNDGGKAIYTAGSGTDTLTFTYVVAPGENTSDLAVNRLALNGGTIEDDAGNKAVLSGAAGSLSGILQIDTVAPKILSITASGPGVTAGSGDLGPGSTVTLTVAFSEAVNVDTTDGTPSLAFNDGGNAVYTSGSGSNDLVFTYTVGTLGSDQNTPNLALAASNAFALNGASITDAAGNAAVLTAANGHGLAGTLQIDTTAPTVTKVATSPTSGEETSGHTVRVTLDMSEKVTVAGSSILLLNDGGTASYDPSHSSATKLAFDYTVASGQVTSDLAVSGIALASPSAIADLAGNAANLAGAGANLGLQINTKSTSAAGPSGGDFTIAGSTDLQLFGSSTANVTLEAGSTGALTLDASTQFAGTVSGLAPGNYLDLPDLGFGAASTLGYAPNSGNTGGALTVSDGVHTANIALLGQYAASSFVTASDGHGGTLITDPPALAAQTQLAQPHA